MEKPQITRFIIIILFIAAIVWLVLGISRSYLVEETAGNLQSNDEVVIQDQSYVFQSSEATDDDSLIKLIFTDPNQTSVSLTTAPTTLLTVRKSMPWWGATPPPPPPRAVPVPIPVPLPPQAGAPSTPTTPPSTPTPTPPGSTPAPQPLPPGVSAVCGNGVVETGEQCEPPNTSTCDANCQTQTGTSYPATCYDQIWNGDESDMNCGGSCPQCLNTGIYTSCWDSSDCQSGNCDVSGAQRPLPVGHTIQTLRQLAGQHWIIPYSGICR